MQDTVDGCIVRFDATDEALFAAHPWRVRTVGSGSGPANRLRLVWYECAVNPSGKRTVITHQFHRIVCGNPKGQITFRNGDTLDMRRSNLMVHETASNRIESPWAPAMLKELYQDSELSIEALTRYAGQMLGLTSPVNEEAVRRWLAAAGIPARSMSEELRRRQQREPENFAEWRSRGIATMNDPRGPGANPGRKAPPMSDTPTPSEAARALGSIRTPRKTAAARENMATARAARSVAACTCGQEPHTRGCPAYARLATQRSRARRAGNG